MQSEVVKGLNTSVVALFAHVNHLGIQKFSQLSNIWEKDCGGDGVRMHIYAYPQYQKVPKHSLYV